MVGHRATYQGKGSHTLWGWRCGRHFGGDPWSTISAMYSFAQVAASNTTEWFKQQKCIVSQVWRLEVRDQSAGRVGSSEAALLGL